MVALEGINDGRRSDSALTSVCVCLLFVHLLFDVCLAKPPHTLSFLYTTTSLSASHPCCDPAGDGSLAAE